MNNTIAKIQETLSNMGVSAITTRSYVTSFKKVIKLAFDGKVPTTQTLVAEEKNIIEKINIGVPNIASRKTIYYGWMKILNNVFGISVERYELELDAICKVIKKAVELKKKNQNNSLEIELLKQENSKLKGDMEIMKQQIAELMKGK